MHSPIAQITRSARNIEDAPKRLHRPGHVAWSRSTALLIAVALTVLAGQTGQGQSPPPPDALKFFKNFFVTGDYLVAGVGLEGLGNNATGLASGVINWVRWVNLVRFLPRIAAQKCWRRFSIGRSYRRMAPMLAPSRRRSTVSLWAHRT